MVWKQTEGERERGHRERKEKEKEAGIERQGTQNQNAEFCLHTELDPTVSVICFLFPVGCSPWKWDTAGLLC